MGKIGAYKYPEHDIETAIDIVERIHNKGITKQEVLAEELGHSSNKSGAFRNKLTSLRRYGLVGSRGDVSLSNLANKIVSPRPNSNERQMAIGEAVKNVDLFNDLFEKLEYGTPNDEEFWYHLVELADVERTEAKEKANNIKSLYESGLDYVQSDTDEPDIEDTGPDSSAGERDEKTRDGRKVPEDAHARLITPDATIDIRGRATYLAAKALFEDIGRQYQSNSLNDGGGESEDSAEMSMNDFL